MDEIEKHQTIGISSGASAPEILVENFINNLKKQFTVAIEEIEIVKGWSGKDFRIYNYIFDGIAWDPTLSYWMSITVEILVSKSDAVILSLSLLISNKKLSKIGRVLFVFKIDPNICRFFSNFEEDIMNFI